MNGDNLNFVAQPFSLAVQQRQYKPLNYSSSFSSHSHSRNVSNYIPGTVQIQTQAAPAPVSIKQTVYRQPAQSNVPNVHAQSQQQVSWHYYDGRAKSVQPMCRDREEDSDDNEGTANTSNRVIRIVQENAPVTSNVMTKSVSHSHNHSREHRQASYVHEQTAPVDTVVRAPISIPIERVVAVQPHTTHPVQAPRKHLSRVQLEYDQRARQLQSDAHNSQPSPVAAGATHMVVQSTPIQASNKQNSFKMQSHMLAAELMGIDVTAKRETGGDSGASEQVPQSVQQYEDILNGPFADFVSLCAKIGGEEMNKLASLTRTAMEAQRDFLWVAAGQSKPDDSTVMSLLGATGAAIEHLVTYRNEVSRKSDYFNHLSAVSESIPALSWVTVAPTPAPHIKELIEAATFYTNRVLKDHKETSPVHCDCVKAWLRTLTDMHDYVKKHHTTGLVWNTAPGCKQTGSTKPVAVPSKAGPPPPGPPPPPPPPPPPTDLMASQSNGAGESTDDRAALFADLNKGLDVTKGLRKVTADMQTHKNPELRVGSKVPATATGSPPPPKIAPKPVHLSNGTAKAAPVVHAPVCELQAGKKWIVEYQKNNNNLVIDIENMRQVVYIYKCENTVIVLKGKVNSITMDSCKKTSVVFDNLVSQMEVINCQSAQVQSLGVMPTLCIQKTDGCQIYLSKESVNAELVTSKSSEMNVLVPDANGEFTEHALPEQYKSVFDGKKLTTTVVDV